MKPKRLLLYSGGFDSTLILHRDRPDVALFVNYGQVHRKEIWFAKEHCAKLDIPLVAIDLPPLQGSSLTGTGGTHVVPARNLVFLSIAANYAEANGFDEILLGCNKDDAKGFPDCRGDFWIAAHHTLEQAGLKVIVRVPLINFTKKKIIRELEALGVPRTTTWSCYLGGETPCGECEACRMRGD